MSLADTPWDVVVVGAGAGGMTAACVAAHEGCRTLLLEQSGQVGGTTAISGGMVWIPANHKSAASGRPDDLEAARTYLSHTVPDADPALLESFLVHGPEAIRYLEQHTAVNLMPVATYPDYYPDLPGATLGGRVLEPVRFDARSLGPDFALLRAPLPEFLVFGGMMVSRQDIPHLRRASCSLRSALHVARLLGRHARERLRANRGTTLVLGNALAARLLASVRRAGVTLATDMTVTRLHAEGGRVMGIQTVDATGVARRFGARKGVVLATGGLSHGGVVRASYVPPAAGTLSATVSFGSSPRGAALAREAGAALTAPTSNGGLWVPVSTFTRDDGHAGVFPHTVTDRAKPGLIAVDARGRRFVNEAVSYHEFVRAQLRAPDTAIPAWLLCDARFLWTYGLGRIKPFTRAVERHVRDGDLMRAGSIEALATAIGVPSQVLRATIDTYNRHAREGRDPEFGRGGDAYQRHLGDAAHVPNPCIAPLEHAPFYAVRVWPADLGMAAGIRTDGQARVVDTHGATIEGLYACGNDMHSVMEGAYPAPGITLGPALTFGYLAGRHVAGRAAA